MSLCVKTFAITCWETPRDSNLIRYVCVNLFAWKKLVLCPGLSFWKLGNSFMCLNTNRTIVNFVLCKNIDKLITVSRLANKGEVEKNVCNWGNYYKCCWVIDMCMERLKCYWTVLATRFVLNIVKIAKIKIE